MTLKEAKNWADYLCDKHGINYYVHKIGPSSYITFAETHHKRHPNMSYVYKADRTNFIRGIEKLDK